MRRAGFDVVPVGDAPGLHSVRPGGGDGGGRGGGVAEAGGADRVSRAGAVAARRVRRFAAAAPAGVAPRRGGGRRRLHGGDAGALCAGRRGCVPHSERRGPVGAAAWSAASRVLPAARMLAPSDHRKEPRGRLEAPRGPLGRLASAAISLYLAFTFRTVRWRHVGDPADLDRLGREAAIIAFWHECLPCMPMLWRRVRERGIAAGGPREAHVLISRHRDGQLISRVVARFGLVTVAGSSGREKQGRRSERGGCRRVPAAAGAAAIRTACRDHARRAARARAPGAARGGAAGGGVGGTRHAVRGGDAAGAPAAELGPDGAAAAVRARRDRGAAACRGGARCGGGERAGDRGGARRGDAAGAGGAAGM